MRGHRDDSTSFDARNKGNFLELVRFRAVSEEALHHHLEAASRNAVYTSKNIQNEMITVIGDALQRTIISEIKKVKYFTILADETPF